MTQQLLEHYRKKKWLKRRGNMARLTIDDLLKIKEKHKAEFQLREGGYRAKVTVHMGTCGIAAGARAVMTAVMDEISKANVAGYRPCPSSR